MSKQVTKADNLGLGLNKINYLILGLGILFIVAGFVFLGIGDITIAPILLVLGYCVIIPVGILYSKKENKNGHLLVEKDA